MHRVSQPSLGQSVRTLLTIAAPLAGLIWTVGCGDDDDGGDGNDAGTAGMSAGRGGGGSSNGGSSGKGSGGKASAGSAGEGQGGATGGSAGDAGAGGMIGGSGGGGDAGDAGDAGSGGGTACTVVPPKAYDGADFYTHTAATTPIGVLIAAASGLTTAPTGLMSIGEVPITTTPVPAPPAAATLLTAFETGTPSLSSVATLAFRTLSGNLFTEHAAAAAATWDGTPAQWDVATAPNNEGGVWHRQAAGTSARIFNERGIETRTIFALGSYAGVFYSYAQSVLDEPVTPAAVHVLLRAFGVENPAMPIGPAMTVPTGTYARNANYAHSLGNLPPIKDAFIRAQAYAGSPDECAAELEDAIDDIRVGWERSAFARVVYYAKTAITAYENTTTPAPEKYNTALHQLAEAAGLAAGWKGVEGKIITEAQLDTLLGYLQHEGLPAVAAATAFSLNGEAPAETALMEIGEVTDFVKAIYDLTDDEITPEG